VVHEYRVLDDCDEKLHSLRSFGIDYVSRRILRTDLHLPVRTPYTKIQPLAARLALEDDEAIRNDCYTSYVKLLCRYIVRCRTDTVATACLPSLADQDDIWDCCEHHGDYDLLSAAVCTNKLSIIEGISVDGQCFRNYTNYGNILGNPFYLAIERGHSAALDLLLNKTSSHPSWSALLAHACHQDPTDLALVQKLLKTLLPMWNRTYSCDGKQETYLDADNGRNMEKLENALSTPSVDAFNLLIKIKESTAYPTVSKRNLALYLNIAARSGWYEMTRHLLALVASHDRLNPLRWACLNGHSAIVDLLLDHGESPTSDAVSCAAKYGRWGLVKRLVALGADINSKVPSPLYAAIALERADMAKWLVSLGAKTDGEFGRTLVQLARKDGLESMLVLLKELKVEGL
jgi:ankyrin repeat protein